MKQKNILFLMTDQQRLDYVSYHGQGKIDTPHMDRTAESVGFTRCVTVNPVCTPARSALLTGKYTHQIGMLSMSGDLSLQHPTYARALQRAGYRTYGIGKFHWLQGWAWDTPYGQGHNLTALNEDMKKYGFDEIWEIAGKQLISHNYCDYSAHLESKGLLEAYRDYIHHAGRNTQIAGQQPFTGEPFPFPEEDYYDIMTADRILECIDNRPEDQPFFILGSFVSPHPPFDPPERYLEQVPYEEADDFVPGQGEPVSDEAKKRLYRVRRAYKAMIRLIDDQIGRIFNKLEDEGILDDTVILFTSDHGEMLGDHGRMQKQSPYWQSVGVPLSIRHPDYLTKELNHTPVEITDITATILEVAGLDPMKELSASWPAFHDAVPCRSLLPIVEGKADRIRQHAFAECNGAWQLVCTDRYKYVRFCSYKNASDVQEYFYDRMEDPDEQVNRIDDPTLAREIEACRRHREYVLDSTPPAQQTWAPLMTMT